MVLFFIALLSWFGASVVRADEPDPHELEAALMIFEHDDEHLQLGAALTAPQRTPSLAYDLLLDVGFTTEGHDPTTVLHEQTVNRPLLGPVLVWRTQDLLQPRPRRSHGSLRAAFGADWEISDFLLLHTLVDTGEIRKGDALGYTTDVTMNGNLVGDELGALAPVRELSITLGDEPASLELGRFRASVGNGLVYDDFSNGARARVSLGKLRGELLASTLGADLSSNLDPLLALDARYELGFFQTVGFFAAYAHDQSGPLSDVLRSALAQRRLSEPARLDALFSDDRGNGQIVYLGVNTQLMLGAGLLVRADVVLSAGQFSVRSPLASDATQTLHDNVKLRGGLANLELHESVSDAIDLSAYAFAISGDDAPTGKGSEAYHGFLGLAPYWAWTGLFFSGGFHQGLLPNRASLSGIGGHGVLGLGPGVALHEGAASYEARAIYLQALSDALPAPFGGGGRTYGFEVDMRARIKLSGGIAWWSELDVLLPGNYFPVQSVAYRVLTFVSLTYGS